MPVFLDTTIVLQLHAVFLMSDDLRKARETAHKADQAGWDAQAQLSAARREYEASQAHPKNENYGCLIVMGLAGVVVIGGILYLMFAGNRRAVEKLLSSKDASCSYGRINS